MLIVTFRRHCFVCLTGGCVNSRSNQPGPNQSDLTTAGKHCVALARFWKYANCVKERDKHDTFTLQWPSHETLRVYLQTKTFLTICYCLVHIQSIQSFFLWGKSWPQPASGLSNSACTYARTNTHKKYRHRFPETHSCHLSLSVSVSSLSLFLMFSFNNCCMLLDMVKHLQSGIIRKWSISYHKREYVYWILTWSHAFTLRSIYFIFQFSDVCPQCWFICLIYSIWAAMNKVPFEKKTRWKQKLVEKATVSSLFQWSFGIKFHFHELLKPADVDFKPWISLNSFQTQLNRCGAWQTQHSAAVLSLWWLPQVKPLLLSDRTKLFSLTVTVDLKLGYLGVVTVNWMHWQGRHRNTMEPCC